MSRSVLIFPTILAYLAAEPLLSQGMELRFHIENTPSAMADSAQGAGLLAISAALFIAAAVLAAFARSSRAAIILLLSPVLAILASLADQETLIPYLLALLASLAALVGLIMAIVRAIKNRHRSEPA